MKKVLFLLCLSIAIQAAESASDLKKPSKAVKKPEEVQSALSADRENKDVVIDMRPVHIRLLEDAVKKHSITAQEAEKSKQKSPTLYHASFGDERHLLSWLWACKDTLGGSRKDVNYFDVQRVIRNECADAATCLLEWSQGFGDLELDELLCTAVPSKIAKRMVPLVLQKGAKIDSTVHFITALHRAVVGNNYAGADLLIEHRADVNVADRTDATTPLMTAARNGNISIIELLLGAKANVRAQDKTGKTAVDRAFGPDARKILQQAMLQSAVPAGAAKEKD